MTTYDFSRTKMDKRLISAGTLECQVYAEWQNQKHEVTIFTESKNKWEYLNMMGLTTSPKKRVYIRNVRTDWMSKKETVTYIPMWRFNAVRLLSMDFNSFMDFKQQHLSEIRNFEDSASGSKTHKLNP